MASQLAAQLKAVRVGQPFKVDESSSKKDSLLYSAQQAAEIDKKSLYEKAIVRCTSLCQRTVFFFGDLNKLVVHQENSFKSILSVNPPPSYIDNYHFFEIECHLPLQLQLWWGIPRQVSCRKKTSLTVSRGDVLVHQEDSLRLKIWDHSRRQPPHRYFDFSCFY